MWHELPKEVIAKISYLVPPHTILAFTQVCKNWNLMTSSDGWIWKELLARNWPALHLPSPTTQNWKREFVKWTSKKAPVICLHTVSKTFSGFGGAKIPQFSEISTTSVDFASSGFAPEGYLSLLLTSHFSLLTSHFSLPFSPSLSPSSLLSPPTFA
jgi:hypothetical protein